MGLGGAGLQKPAIFLKMHQKSYIMQCLKQLQSSVVISEAKRVNQIHLSY